MNQGQRARKRRAPETPHVDGREAEKPAGCQQLGDPGDRAHRVRQVLPDIPRDDNVEVPVRAVLFERSVEHVESVRLRLLGRPARGLDAHRLPATLACLFEEEPHRGAYLEQSARWPGERIALDRLQRLSEGGAPLLLGGEVSRGPRRPGTSRRAPMKRPEESNAQARRAGRCRCRRGGRGAGSYRRLRCRRSRHRWARSTGREGGSHHHRAGKGVLQRLRASERSVSSRWRRSRSCRFR